MKTANASNEILAGSAEEMQQALSEMSDQISKLTNDLKEVAQCNELLTAQLQHMKTMFKLLGMPVSAWVSPADAARSQNVSRATIMDRMEIAQALESLVGGYEGVFYRDISKAESTNPTWQINLSYVEKLMVLKIQET